MQLETLNDLRQHMEWADAAVWTAVLGCEEARKDPKLRERLYHLHLVQYAFLRIWRGESPETPYPVFDEIEPLLDWSRAYCGEAAAFLQPLGSDELSKPLPLPWAARISERIGRTPEVSTLGETALQVVMHSQYHRGQINTRLREFGGEPPLVDYIAWVWLGRPDAAWPSVAE